MTHSVLIRFAANRKTSRFIIISFGLFMYLFGLFIYRVWYINTHLIRGPTFIVCKRRSDLSVFIS